jgi:hypothetical protein
VSADAALDPVTAQVPSNWSVLPASTGVPVAATVATLSATATSVELHVETGLSPSEDYDVTAPGVLGADLLPLTGTDTLTAPGSDPDLSDEWPHGPLRAILRAACDELSTYADRLTTISTRDFADGDTVLHGETFLGWPATGAFWAAGRRYTYTAVDASYMTLTGVRRAAATPDDGQTLTDGAEVLHDVAAYLPD